MHFTGVWRDYQQRVLDDLEAHLDDDRIHVVAAPGSGKTVLGLEIIRRLGRRTILLNPTLTIRNQWAARLVPLFMEEPPDTGFLTYNLEHPSALTSSTYQALHALWADENPARFSELIRACVANGPITIVLDEAHHLRREWWKALQAFVEALEDVQIVALTATPPYGAPPAEWARYEAMCGPADFEIGIPELVRCGDLCPHQDHIIFSRPSDSALELLDRRREALSNILIELRADTDLLDALQSHPWVVSPDEYEEAVLEKPEVLSAMLVHLSMSNEKLPKAPLHILGAKARDIPPQTAQWAETLLNALLIDSKESFAYPKDKAKALYKRLQALGLVEGKRVRLGETQRIFRLMANDRSKLRAIADIAKQEAHSMGYDLRMVILTDHVRASDLPSSPGAEFAPAKIGVGPIFEQVRRGVSSTVIVGVLSGTLVIIPKTAVAALEALIDKTGIAPELVKLRKLKWCDTHLRVDASSAAKSHIVEWITRLLCDGDITALVGTQALLGEGWDAPAINSLILASNSASYMLSNQMRGRAIRIDPQRRDKVSNIWHLATVEQIVERDEGGPSGFFNWGSIVAGRRVGSDLALLSRRFSAFAGISRSDSDRIENGIERLDPFAFDTIEQANELTFAYAAKRDAIAARWQRSLGVTEKRSGRLTQRHTAKPNHSPRSVIWHHTVEALAASGLASGVMAAGWQVAQSGSPFGVAIMGVGGIGALASLPRTLKASYLLARNGTLENSLHQVGNVLLDSLQNARIITDQEYSEAEIHIGSNIGGTRDISFAGLSTQSQNIALGAVQELLGPVRNPRYLLIRRSLILNMRRTDYHSVPTVIGQRKEWATYFAERWSKQVNPSRLVFTRNRDGRRTLLRARSRSLAAGLQRHVERSTAWV